MLDDQTTCGTVKVVSLLYIIDTVDACTAGSRDDQGAQTHMGMQCNLQCVVVFMVCSGGGSVYIYIYIYNIYIYVCVCARSVFVMLLPCILYLCMCLCMGPANNQENGKVATSQQKQMMIGMPISGFEPAPSSL